MTDKIRAFLAVLILAACFALVWRGYGMTADERPDQAQVWVLVGLVGGFYFGSSAGSARANDRAEKVTDALLATTAAGTTVNADTAEVSGGPVTVESPPPPPPPAP